MYTRGQLFVRVPVGIDAPNTYLVCGLIKTNVPLTDESIHSFCGDITVINSRNVKKTSSGSGLDGIMQEPLWNLNIKE